LTAFLCLVCFVVHSQTPIFVKEVQSGVPADTIKGAALAGAALAFIASHGVLVTSAAGLTAAYIAISQGVAGDVLRTVGGITWDVTEAAANLYKMATSNEKIAGMSKELADRVIVAVETRQDRAATLQQTEIESNGDSQEVEEATEAYMESQEELTRVLLEAESAIDAADAAIARANETLGTDEFPEEQDEKAEEESRLLAQEQARLADDEKVEEESRLLAQEQARLAEVEKAEEESRLLAQEQARLAEVEKVEEESRLLAEEQARLAEVEKVEEESRLLAEEQARLAEEERVAKETHLEEEKLREEFRQAQEEVRLKEEDAKAVRLEEEKLREELRQAQEEVRLKEEEAAADEYDDEWEAAVELAQQGLEGTIVGLEEAITDDGAKATWDAAGMLAQELQQGPGDDEFDDEEGDLDLGRVAREAVEMFEDEMGLDAATVTDSEDSDLAAADEMLPEGDLEDIARAARDAVKLMSDEGVDEEYEEEEEESFEGFEDQYVDEPKSNDPVSSRDWNSLTVGDLKIELKNRGLKTYGKKTELVSLLQAYDVEQFGAVLGEEDDEAAGASEDNSSSDSDSDFMDMEDVDLEELGRQARAAVERQDTGESKVEAWLDLEDDDGESIDLEELGKQARAAVDANFADEPSDEVLKQLESEEPLLFQDAGALSMDYTSMTVAQLKDELRSKGLRLSGKKADLIERLQSS
jgi:hypothetical protein